MSWPSEIEDPVAYVADSYPEGEHKLATICVRVIDRDHLETDGIVFERVR